MALTSMLIVGALAATASAASATSFSPAGTAVTGTAGTTTLVSGTGNVSCTSSQVTGTTPSGSGSGYVSGTNETLSYSGCTAFGLPATVTVASGCVDIAGDYNGGSPNVRITLLNANCVRIVAGFGSCQMTLPKTGGQQVFGTYDNATHKATFSNASVGIVTVSGFCPGAGTTAAFSGVYDFTPSGMTINP